jgi:hypothetical protein
VGARHRQLHASARPQEPAASPVSLQMSEFGQCVGKASDGPQAIGALEPPSIATPSRNLAVGMARAHHLERGGCNCDATAGCVPAPCTCGAAVEAQDVAALPARSALMCQGNQAAPLPVTVRWLKTNPMLVAQRYAGHEKGDFDDAYHHDSRIACLCHGGLLGGHASWTRQMREEVPRGNVRAANGSTEATPGGCLGSQVG